MGSGWVKVTEGPAQHGGPASCWATRGRPRACAPSPSGGRCHGHGQYVPPAWGLCVQGTRRECQPETAPRIQGQACMESRAFHREPGTSEITTPLPVQVASGGLEGSRVVGPPSASPLPAPHGHGDQGPGFLSGDGVCCSLPCASSDPERDRAQTGQELAQLWS